MNSSVGRYGAGPGERKLSWNTKPLVCLIASHRIFLFNDGRQVSRLSCCFWHLHVAKLGGSCAQGRASTRGSRAGTAAGIFQFRSEGGRTCNNLQYWKMQLSITAAEIEKPPLNWSQQLTDLPLWQLLCIYQSGKTLIIPQQSMSSKRQSLCCIPMPITLSCRHCCIQKHILLSTAPHGAQPAAPWERRQLQSSAQSPDSHQLLCTSSLSPQPRWNKLMSSPRFGADSVWFWWLCKVNWALQTLRMWKQTLLQILFRVQWSMSS